MATNKAKFKAMEAELVGVCRFDGLRLRVPHPAPQELRFPRAVLPVWEPEENELVSPKLFSKAFPDDIPVWVFELEKFVGRGEEPPLAVYRLRP